MKDIALIVPSRSRAASLSELHDSIQATRRRTAPLSSRVSDLPDLPRKNETISPDLVSNVHSFENPSGGPAGPAATGVGVDLYVGLDADDPQRWFYPAVGMRYVVRSGLRNVVPWMNELARHVASEYRVVGMVGDDNRFRTDGWPERIMEALEKTPFAFGNDLYPREPGSHCAHIFCRSEIINALGYLGIPCVRHMFVDNAWMEWGKACGITYLPNVIIEHMHFTVGKSEYDDTYKSGVDLWDRDKVAWEHYQANDLATDIQKIKDACASSS